MIRDFWQPIPIAGLKDRLAALRDEVISRNPKRCPKWGFRLGPDLAVQLQPRPLLAEWHSTRPQPLFLGAVAHAEAGVGEGVFRRRQAQFFVGDGTPRCWLKFEVIAGEPEWLFKATYRHVARDHHRGAPGFRDVWLDSLRSRLVAELPSRLNVFDVGLMLRPACLCCGKDLTDPASIARWVGPECAGNGSLTVPGLDRAAAAWSALAGRMGLEADTPPEIVHDYALDNR